MAEIPQKLRPDRDFEVAEARHVGQRQSEPSRGVIAGSSLHQQFSRPSSGPHVKPAPHLQQRFRSDRPERGREIADITT